MLEHARELIGKLDTLGIKPSPLEEQGEEDEGDGDGDWEDDSDEDEDIDMKA